MNLPAYLFFVGRFATGPRAALQPYQGQSTIDPSLAFYALAGSVLGAIIIAIASWARTVQRRDAVDALGPIVPRLVMPPWSLIAWPAASAVAILSLTAIIHGFAAIWLTVGPAIGTDAFNDALVGGWRDTVNAFCAANALLSPLMAVIVTAARLWRQGEQMLYLAFSGALFGYTIAAVAGTHPNTGLGQASGVLFAPISVPAAVLLFAGWILRTLSRFASNIQRQ